MEGDNTLSDPLIVLIRNLGRLAELGYSRNLPSILV